MLGFDWGIAGAAWATVTSEGCICLVTTLLILKRAPLALWRAVRGQVLEKSAWRTLFAANADITVRTLLLTGSLALMTERGAKQGFMELAANQILMHAFLLVANLLDGFATAAEVFGGRVIGARSRSALVQIVRRCALLSLGWSLTLSLGLIAAKPWYLGVMTSNRSLQETASRYWPWVALLPVVCIWTFLWDGVFMSAMRARTLRNTMAASVLVYVPTLFLSSSLCGNHGVWAALTALMAARSVFLTLVWPRLRNAVGAPT